MLFLGDDWAEDHHDVEFVDESGRRLVRARLPEGLEGIARLHALVAEHGPASWAGLPVEEAAGQVVVGIETERSVGDGAAVGRLSGVRDQSAVLGSVSAAVLDLGCEE